MNQIYRALHMPPGRLLRKLTGSKEIYTIALRPIDPENPLPALGGGAFTPLPYRADFWYADPMLVQHQGKTWLFCEAYRRAEHRGEIAVFPIVADGTPGAPQTVISEAYHLSFPNVFWWNDQFWMLPESCANHSLNLYRCTEFPGGWQLAAAFEVGCELCDTILLERTPDALTLLCSETDPKNQLFVRWRRYTLRRTGQEQFALEADEAFNGAHSAFNLTDRNAGPLFELGGQTVHATQVSTRVDYGVYLQFFARRGAGPDAAEAPLCAAAPAQVQITGLAAADIVGVHSYGRTDTLEVIDARYLHKDAPEGGGH